LNEIADKCLHGVRQPELGFGLGGILRVS
jgi:hypothetical protein